MEIINLDQIDITTLESHIKAHVSNFVDQPGLEPYTLYSFFSSRLKAGAKVADLGTLQGLSALALSYNPDVQVTSYDIDLSKNIVEKDSIIFVQGNCFDHLDDILQSDLILIDIDPHDGIQEQDFYDILLQKHYSGITLWDDIHHNLGMKNFWHKVESKKTDLTNVGHHSGTGLIEFR